MREVKQGTREKKMKEKEMGKRQTENRKKNRDVEEK